MITVTIEKSEIPNFQYMLPVQGCLSTLELTEAIFEKIKNGGDIQFSKEEFDFINASIDLLDQRHQLQFQCLSLIRKFRNYEEK